MDNTHKPPPHHQVNRAMSVTMTHGLEKLEKLLSRRKRGSSTRSTDLARANSLSISTSSCANIPQFPQTPYIRPMASRMFARDEPSALDRFGSRSHSLPESSGDSSTQRLSVSRHSVASMNNRSSEQLVSRIPKRCSSLLASRDVSLASLDAFCFAGALAQYGKLGDLGVERAEPSPREVAPHIELKIDVDEVQTPKSAFDQPRPITPPPSDHDDSPTSSVGCQHGAETNRISIVVHPSEPTPAPSPEILPTPIEQPVEPVPEAALESVPLLKRESVKLESRPRSSESRRASKSTVQLRRSVSTSGIRNDSTLREPNFGDFLSLKDEDIAEQRPSTPPPPAIFDVGSPSTVTASTASSPSFVSSSSSRLRLFTPPSRPPVCRAPAPPPLSFPANMRNANSTAPTSRSTSTSTSPRSLAPPLSPIPANQRAATAAAFESTRIATKHQLDLVYVVQLWPKRMTTTSTARAPYRLSSKSAPASPTRRSRDELRTRNSVTSIRSHTITAKDPDPDGKRGRAAAAIRRSPLAARVLCGHGLAAVKPPMFLSGTLHAKMLDDARRYGENEQRRWFEIRNADASTPEHYALGLSTAFFAEQVPTLKIPRRRQSNVRSMKEANDAGAEGDDESTTTVTARPRSRLPRPVKDSVTPAVCMNKGVLFVAYRKVGTADQTLPEIDLDELHRDAEILVGMSLAPQADGVQARGQNSKEDLASRPSTGVSAAASMAATKRLADLCKPLPMPPPL